MAEFPALPLWTDAYIGDTAHLTNEEHGVYLRLRAKEGVTDQREQVRRLEERRP